MISFSNDLVLETGTGESRTIYCGLPKIDPDNYRRDYVIQRDSKKNSKEENPLEFKWNASLVSIRDLTLLYIVFILQRAADIQRTFSSSSSSEDSEASASEDSVGVEEVRVTDSGVDSEQNSIATTASTEKEVGPPTSSQEEESSSHSGAVIERETVSRMRNIFEQKIFQSKAEAETVRKPSMSSKYSYSQPNLLQARGEFPSLPSPPSHHLEEEKERSRTSSESSEDTVGSPAVEAEQREPTRGSSRDFLERRLLSETQTNTREPDISSEVSDTSTGAKETAIRKSLNPSEVRKVSVGRLKHNFDGSDRTVVARTEVVRDSEVRQVSVGKLKSSYEELLVRQREQSEQSFLRWRTSHLPLKPKYQPDPTAVNTNTTVTTNHNDNMKDQDLEQDSLSVSSLESLEEDNKLGEREGETTRATATPAGEKRASPASPETTDIRTGRVSVTQLKNIWAAKKVEVNTNPLEYGGFHLFLSMQERKSKEEYSNIPEDLRKFFQTDNKSESRKEERNFVVME